MTSDKKGENMTKVTKTKKVTKTNQVLEHLKKHGMITSWVAIEQYRATRLSAIIFNLRKRGYDIETQIVLSKDCNGNPCPYATYILKGQE